MGKRVVGGHFKKVVAGTESNFKGALKEREVPMSKPVRSFGSADQSRDAKLKSFSGMDVQRNAPLFNDPRYTSSTLSIPTDNRTLHGLYRFFTETDPIVGASLKMHSELPLADVGLGQCEDTGVQQHFEQMWDNINGVKLLTDIVSEHYEIGDVFPFGAFDEANYMWDQFAILNPDYVKVDSTWVNQKPLIKLIPDENLKRIVQSRSPRFIFEQLPPEVVRYVLFSKEIPLDPNNVFHISHAKRPYELRGRSLIKRILKLLMLEDRFNQANFALATRHAVPLTVVKVGDAQTGWVPNETELADVRDLFAAWELDPNFCYDEETECLTKNGWKKYDDLNYDTEIACFDPENNSLVYDKPSYINIQDYKGEMYHFKSRSMDMKVTPNHRMFVQRDGKWQIILAEDVVEGDQFKNSIEENDQIKILEENLIVEKEDIQKEYYEGKIWCPTVKTGIIVTRRSGRNSFQGNSIFYHYGINVEFYGSNGKMLPIGPELDRIYRLKFIGLQMHEQLLAGGGGSYSQAYVNLEVQRQRYLNLQLKLEQFLHEGMFKPVADLCGFYRVRKATSGYNGVNKYTFGNSDPMMKNVLAQFSTVNDLQDNKQFREFATAKAKEHEKFSEQQERDYVFPRIDWGAMSAATDENLKNYIKWLAKERPYLVDDATLARLGNLDRDTQEQSYLKDLERTAARIKKVSEKGYTEIARAREKKGTGGGGDMFGGDIPLGGGGDMGGMPLGEGEPNAAIGEGGPPEAANAENPPSGIAAAISEKDLIKTVSSDDIHLQQENSNLLKQRSSWVTSIERVIDSEDTSSN